MKKLAIMMILLSMTLACDQKTDDNSETVVIEEMPTESEMLEGAWRMKSRISYENGLPVDTAKMGDRYAQVKMYVDGSVMWSQMTPEDSAKWYGYGTYMVLDGELIELMEYGSDEFMQFLQTQNKFDFELTIDENSYTQVDIDSLNQTVSAEYYVRVD